jgi:hypothetical protein
VSGLHTEEIKLSISRSLYPGEFKVTNFWSPVQGERVMLEEALLVLWLESKKKGKQQLQDQFNNLQPEIQVDYYTTKHYTLFTSVSRINYRLFARELYLHIIRLESLVISSKFYALRY